MVKIQKLPIKSRKKILVNERLLKEISEEELKNQIVESSPLPQATKVNKVVKKKEKDLTTLYARRKLKIKHVRLQIFLQASKISENPEQHISKLKILFAFLKEKDSFTKFTIFKLTITSLCDIFCDLIPGYKIVEQEDTGEKLIHKKEVKHLKAYEEGLLKYYKQYLAELSSTFPFLWKDRTPNSEVQVKHGIAKVALQCMCTILRNHPHFNFTPKLITAVIPFGFHRDASVRSIVSDAFINVFKEDKLGATSLLIVKSSFNLAEKKDYKIPGEFLAVYLNLNLNLARKDGDASHDMKKIREELRKLSRQERKRKKKIQGLEKELKETEAREGRDKKSHFQTEIMKILFNIYFKILKSDSKSKLLAPVLEGLSKFALLINIDFFDDLLKVLNKILDEQDLSIDEILYCLITVFSMLSGQGASLNIDPQKFYKHLYEIIWKIPHVNEKTEGLFKQCFELMFIKRSKSVPLPRVLAFVKRISLVSLYCKYNFTLDKSDKIHGDFEMNQTLNSFCLQLLKMHPKADCLVDFDSEIGTGTYKPEMEDPDFCNATSTHLYELIALKRHICKDVRKISQDILRLKQ